MRQGRLIASFSWLMAQTLKFHRIIGPPSTKPSILLCANSPYGLVPSIPLIKKGYDVILSISPSHLFNGLSLIPPITAALLVKHGVPLGDLKPAPLTDWVWSLPERDTLGSVRIARFSWRASLRTNLSELESFPDLFPPVQHLPGAGVPPKDTIGPVAPVPWSRSNKLLHTLSKAASLIGDSVLRPLHRSAAALPLPTEIRPIVPHFASDTGALAVPVPALTTCVLRGAIAAASAPTTPPPGSLFILPRPVHAVAYDPFRAEFVLDSDTISKCATGGITGGPLGRITEGIGTGWVGGGHHGGGRQGSPPRTCPQTVTAVLSSDPAFLQSNSVLAGNLLASGRAKPVYEAPLNGHWHFSIQPGHQHGAPATSMKGDSPGPASTGDAGGLSDLPPGVVVEVPSGHGAGSMWAVRHQPMAATVGFRPVLLRPAACDRLAGQFPVMSAQSGVTDAEAYVGPRSILGRPYVPSVFLEAVVLEMQMIASLGRPVITANDAWPFVTDIVQRCSERMQIEAMARSALRGRPQDDRAPALGDSLRPEVRSVLPDRLARGPGGRLVVFGPATFTVPDCVWDVTAACTMADVDVVVEALPPAAELDRMPVHAASKAGESDDPHSDNTETDHNMSPIPDGGAGAAGGQDAASRTPRGRLDPIAANRARVWEASVVPAIDRSTVERYRKLEKVARASQRLIRTTMPSSSLFAQFRPLHSFLKYWRKFHPLYRIRHARFHRLIAAL